MEIQISSSLVKTESWLSLFLSCSYVMLRTQQKRQEEAGHPMESKARNKDVCARVHLCVWVCVCMFWGRVLLGKPDWERKWKGMEVWVFVSETEALHKTRKALVLCETTISFYISHELWIVTSRMILLFVRKLFPFFPHFFLKHCGNLSCICVFIQYGI